MRLSCGVGLECAQTELYHIAIRHQAAPSGTRARLRSSSSSNAAPSPARRQLQALVRRRALRSLCLRVHHRTPLLSAHLPDAGHPVGARHILTARLPVNNHLIGQQHDLRAKTVNCEIAQMEIFEIDWAHLCHFCITIVQTVRVEAYKRGIKTSAECIHLLVSDCLPHYGLFTNPSDRSLGHRCCGAAHEGAYKQPNPTHRDLPRLRVRSPPPNAC